MSLEYFFRHRQVKWHDFPFFYPFTITTMNNFLQYFKINMIKTINSIFERIIDILRPRFHPEAKIIKDMMAAIVLIASISSVVIGLSIFLPKIFELFS